MSAVISINQAGQAECFVAGAPAWHRLGVNVRKAQTWQDATKLAKLDWTISKVQLHNPRTNDLIPSHAIVRDDSSQWLATVGDDYVPIQNAQCFDFVDALIGTKKAHYISAGALQGGKVVWCLAKIDTKIEPVKGDLQDVYLLFGEYRGTKAAFVKVCYTRVVCQNTLSMAIGEDRGTTLRLRHTAGVTAKLEEAKKLISGVEIDAKLMEEKLKKLVAKKLDRESFGAIMTRLFPTLEKSSNAANQAAVVATNFASNDAHAFPATDGTAYSLFQAYTQYVDHQKGGFRGGSTDERRAENAMFGAGAEYKLDALDAICEMCDISAPKLSAIDNVLSKLAI